MNPSLIQRNFVPASGWSRLMNYARPRCTDNYNRHGGQTCSFRIGLLIFAATSRTKMGFRSGRVLGTVSSVKIGDGTTTTGSMARGLWIPLSAYLEGGAGATGEERVADEGRVKDYLNGSALQRALSRVPNERTEGGHSRITRKRERRKKKETQIEQRARRYELEDICIKFRHWLRRNTLLGRPKKSTRLSNFIVWMNKLFLFFKWWSSFKRNSLPHLKKKFGRGNWRFVQTPFQSIFW